MLIGAYNGSFQKSVIIVNIILRQKFWLRSILVWYKCEIRISRSVKEACRDYRGISHILIG